MYIARLAAQGYDICATALERAVLRGDVRQLTKEQVSNEVQWAQQIRDRLLNECCGYEEEDLLLLPWLDASGMSEVRLMAKTALTAAGRKLRRDVSGIRSRLAGELAREEREQLRQELRELEKKLQENTREVASGLDPCAEPKFGLTIDQILDSYEGKQTDDTEKWIL